MRKNRTYGKASKAIIRRNFNATFGLSRDELKVGWVMVGDPVAGRYWEIDIIVSIPKGWLPADPDDNCHELLNCPHLVDGKTAQVTTPTGALKAFSVEQIT